LSGFVGPGFDIGLLKEGGGRAIRLDPGEYTLEVADGSDLHNFHLVGPGVDERTGIEFSGSETFDVTLADGSYRYYCDSHYPLMLGSFTVGAEPPRPPLPPPLPRLYATVGPGARIVLTRPDRRRVRSVQARTYAIVVRDRSPRHNFHLSWVKRKTGLGFVGTVTWRVTLVRGRYYVYFSDAAPSLVKDGFRAV
jgi:hypothetical protein